MSNSKRSIRIFIEAAIVLAFFCLVFLNIAIPIHADTKTEGYELLRYEQTAEVRKSHEYAVSLKMTINAPKGLSSIDVNLPSGKYSLTGVKTSGCTGQAMQDGNGNDYIKLKPDDKNKQFHQGKSTLRVTYLIREYKESNPNYDMFLYDALPSNWDVPIKNLKLTMKFPEDFNLSDLQYYAGQYGAQDVANTLTYKLTGKKLVMTGSKLPSNFGITFKAQLADGYWEGALDNSWTAKLSVFLLGITLLLILQFWVIGGRDPKVEKTKEIHPIDGVTPADIGFLFYGHTRIRDIGVLIVYLAIHGYLKIVEYKPKKYTLVPLAEPKEEERYIRTAYNILFEDVYEGRPLEPKRMHARLRTVLKNVGVSIENGFSAPDMQACTTLSKVLRVVSILLLSACMAGTRILTMLYQYQEVTVTDFLVPMVILVALLFAINARFDSRYDTDERSYRFSMGLLAGLYELLLLAESLRFWMMSHNLVVCISVVVCGTVSMLLTLIMKKRGKGNAAIVNRILCLRSYMSSVKSADLARENLVNQEYYYEMLPYALTFSQEEIWARKFRWLGSKGSEFYEKVVHGNTMAIGRGQRRSDQVARDLKTFCRTIENDYHMTNRKRRVF
ncbi:MAG: DUF2207 domain-containing protein [Eubacteriales bacterium]|nr:DUF2207 domain-containing protein [Eubacteriales bacterium]